MQTTPMFQQKGRLPVQQVCLQKLQWQWVVVALLDLRISRKRRLVQAAMWVDSQEQPMHHLFSQRWHAKLKTFCMLKEA
jgi:hypothetical protein